MKENVKMSDPISELFPSDTTELVSFVDSFGRKFVYSNTNIMKNHQTLDVPEIVAIPREDLENLTGVLNIVSQLFRKCDDINNKDYGLTDDDVETSKNVLSTIYEKIYHNKFNVYDNGYELALDRLFDQMDGLIYSLKESRVNLLKKITE